MSNSSAHPRNGTPAPKSAQKSSGRSLGRDPFADLDELDWDLEVPDTSPPSEFDAEDQTTEGSAKEAQLTTSEPVPEPEATATDPNLESKPAGAEVPASSQMSAKTLDKATPARPKDHLDDQTRNAEPKSAVQTGKLEKAVTGFLTMPGDIEPPPEKVIEADEPTAHILDELIATIDEEIEASLEAGVLAPVAHNAPTLQKRDEEQFVIFMMAGTEYAVSIDNVLEISRPLDVTPVPNVPEWVLGVTNLRGDVLSVIDPRTFLGLATPALYQTGRMLVAQAEQENSSIMTGLLVDRVNEIRFLAKDRIGAPAAPIEDQIAPYLQGVYDHDGRMLVVLDLTRLLFSTEMLQFEPI